MYLYKVCFWDEIEKECVDVIGFTSSENYVTAMDKVAKYFGPELISVSLEEIEDFLEEDDILALLESADK